jgi:arylsulfatase A-like enzyme
VSSFLQRRLTALAPWLFAVTAALPVSSSGVAAEKVRPPSVVFILADDLGWGDVGFNGRTDWKTPHLDNLASQVTNFKRWYTAAVVCAPSRAALMTGKYGINNGVSGLADNTIVVFSSDHGATFEAGNEGASAYHDSNRPLRGQKRTLWEGGIRVPGLVRWPGKVPAGKESHEVFHNTDLLPTHLSAAGIKADAELKLDGRDLLAVWQGKEKSPPRTLFWEWRVEGYNQLAAMRGDRKLVITHGGKPELFDVESDPSERRNIVAEHPELAKQLEKELKDWLGTETEASKWGKTPPKP